MNKTELVYACACGRLYKINSFYSGVCDCGRDVNIEDTGLKFVEIEE